MIVGLSAVDAIIRDLCRRSGGDAWWGSIAPDVQREIRYVWADIIEQEIAGLDLDESG